MDELFRNFKKGYGELHQYEDIDSLTQNFMSMVCKAIDYELCDLKDMVEDNTYSVHDISEKIQEIRKKIY